MINNVLIPQKWANFLPISDKKSKDFKQLITSWLSNWEQLILMKLILWEEGLKSSKDKKNKCKQSLGNILIFTMVWTSISKNLIKKPFLRKKLLLQFMKFLIRHQPKQSIFSDIIHISLLFSLYFQIYLNSNF